jgi:hypothetical protein
MNLSGMDMRITSSYSIEVSFHINYYVMVPTNFGGCERRLLPRTLFAYPDPMQ